MLNIDDRLIKEVSPKIKPNALSVLLAIAIHLNKQNGRCFPSIKRLMGLTGLGRGAVYTALNVLKEVKILTSFQAIDTKTKKFGQRTFKVSTKFISIFVTAEDAEPLTENPHTDEPQAGDPHTDDWETQRLNEFERLNQLEQINNEGERTPPAPNPSNLQSQKKESGLVAPAENPKTVKAEKKEKDFIPRGAAPADCDGSYGVGKIEFYPNLPAEVCPDCSGRGNNTTGGHCWKCSGTGEVNPNPSQFEVTAIASPTDLPGVTLIEAAPIPHRKNGRIEIPDEAAAEILPWVKGDGEQTVKSWYDRAFRQHSPKDVEDMVMRFSTVFLSSEKAAFRDMMETNPLSFFKRRFAGFVADQKQYDRNNAPKEGVQTRQNGQPEKTLISNMRQL